jgi:hypothetical protein
MKQKKKFLGTSEAIETLLGGKLAKEQTKKNGLSMSQPEKFLFLSHLRKV